ncbi:hypothetical protein G9A89_001510 [Geosiphon pyriformis]|nr:hypothetical protein G9A89_001510 [Geosiphon pyriformis]
MGDYSYLSQQSKEYFKAHNKNDLDFIELNPLPSCLICFSIEEQSSRQFQDFWNWFLNEHSAETYIAYTTYYFNQAYFEDNFKERNNSINQLLYFTIFKQQPPNLEYLNHQIHIWIAAHQSTETSLETEKESYQTTLGKETTLHYHYSELDDFKRAATANQYDNKYKFQIVGGYFQGSSATWFLQETNANAPANAKKDNTSFTTQFETKFRTSILISKWRMELEKKTQGPDEVKIHSFTKRLRTYLLYAFWPLLRIENNQRIHLGSTLSVFAPAFVMASALQMAATSFAPKQSETISNSKDPDLNPASIKPNNHYIKDNKIVAHLPNNNNVSNQRPNYANINFFGKNPLIETTGESASQPEENLFYIFNLTDDDHNMNKLAINMFESTRKKKKAKIDFVIDLNKASKSSADNNELPKAKVFKNLPKLELSEIFRKDLHKSLIPKKKTPKTNKRSHQARLADNNNVTPLICKAQVAGYFIDLILDSRSSVSVIAKHFFEAISRKINEPSTRPMTNVHNNKKKGLGIAKVIFVHINNISIKTDMEVSEAKEYTIIVGNKWLKKAKALLNYELCELTIRYGEKPIVIKCHYWTTPPIPKQNQKKEQSDESDDDESNDKDQEKQEETVELTYTIFTSNEKPLDNIKTDKEGIIVNGKLICWPYYNIFRKTFNRKPGKKAKYSYWWHGSLQKFFENEPPEIQSIIVEQKESSSEKRKVEIENLLAKNSPVISKEGDTPGQTHVIQHTITTKKTCPIYLKPYQSN